MPKTNETYQVEPTSVEAGGTIHKLAFKNSIQDVKVGALADEGSKTTLPGNGANELLSETLLNIRAYLKSLQNLADQETPLSLMTGVGDEEGASLLATADTIKAIRASLKGLEDAIGEINEGPEGKAPMKHAVANVATHGGGTSTLYGHVKLSDVYKTALEGEGVGAADSSIAASQKALYDAYKELSDAMDLLAPTDHASTDTTYGIGTGTKYGHVMLADEYALATEEDGGANSGKGASLYALKSLSDAITTALGDKLASSHADKKASTLDLGHVTLTDSYTAPAEDEDASGQAASRTAVSDLYTALDAAKADKNHTHPQQACLITTLWENTAADKSTFAGQSITLTVPTGLEYKVIEVFAQFSGADAGLGTFSCRARKGDPFFLNCVRAIESGTAVAVVHRDVTFSEDGGSLVFGDGMSSEGNADTWAISLAIYAY